MEAERRAVPAILLVLMDEQEARNLSWTLSIHYDCMIAASGAEALRLAGARHVDAIICDAQLEDMSGTQCLFDFRTRQPTAIRFLCGMGTDSREFADALHVAAVYEYLRKPLLPELVALSLKRALEYREISREHRQLAHNIPRQPGSKDPDSNPSQTEGGTLKEHTESLERDMVISALKRFHGNQSRAAKALGLSRVGLANKIKRYAIDIEIA